MSTVDLQVFTQKGLFVKPGIPNPAPAIDGSGKLLQYVLKCLLTTPGSDIFNPTWGSGLVNALPDVGAADPNGNQAVQNDVAVAVGKCEALILSAQSGENSDPTELLKALTLISCTFSVSQTAWLVSISITSQAGLVNTAQVAV